MKAPDEMPEIELSVIAAFKAGNVALSSALLSAAPRHVKTSVTAGIKRKAFCKSIIPCPLPAQAKAARTRL